MSQPEENKTLIRIGLISAMVLICGLTAHHFLFRAGGVDLNKKQSSQRALKSIHPLKSSKELLQRGKSVYARQCVSCHGKEGRGDGPTAKNLPVMPRDFKTLIFRTPGTPEATLSIEDIYKTITVGRMAKMMPSFEHLSENDRWGLVYYVKRLALNNELAESKSDQ